MIDPKILAQVRRLEIVTGRLVTETFAGEYQSVFKGRGMEFAEVREYSPGDDNRIIDWNVTARTGRLFVRQYTEERELTVAIACDLSGSQGFGTAQLKKEVAAEVAAVLAFSAMKNNDKVALALFTEQVEEFVPPRKGRQHILHLIRDLLAFEPEGTGTRLAPCLDVINRMLKRRSILFLISDFRDQGFERALRLSSLKHDLVPIVIRDPAEKIFPALGALVAVEDPETGARAYIDAGRKSALAAIKKAEEARERELEQVFSRLGLDAVFLSTDQPYMDALVRFFHRRAKRLGR